METTTPNPTPAPEPNAAAPTSQPQATSPTPPKPTAAPTPEEKEWNADTFKRTMERFKNNPEEVAKAYWHANRENSKLVNQSKKAAPTSEAPVNPAAAKEQAEQSKAMYKHHTELLGAVHRELMDVGKISEDTKAAFKQAGYSDADINRETQLRSIYIQDEMKKAQKYTEVPVQDLFRFAQKEGNLSDSELAFIQDGLNRAVETGDPAYYRVIKIVEDRMKAKNAAQPVEHGTVAEQPAYSGDGFATAAEWIAAKKDHKYNNDQEYTASVNEKFKRSNTSSWTNDILSRRI